jgi:hypothetical protein
MADFSDIIARAGWYNTGVGLIFMYLLILKMRVFMKKNEEIFGFRYVDA